MDNSFSAWKNVIKNSNIKWINGSDLKFTNGPTSIAYNITTIPHNFLIDGSGIIIEENIPLDQLKIKITNLIE